MAGGLESGGVSDLNYLLVLLTHGRHGPADTLERTLASFLERVTPRPVRVYLHQDGPGSPHFYGEGGFPWPITFAVSEPQVGFCAATAKAWKFAAESPCEHVFWLEHDFEFVRDVDLRDLVAVLDADPMLAQMALCRDAANEAERAAGGLVESRPGEFEPRGTYLEHRCWWTTNPSLIRRDFMVENEWPEGAECEGRFGIELRERGYRFGLWGDGSVGVEHVGVRTGKGY